MKCKRLEKYLEEMLDIMEPNTWIGTAREYHNGEISAYHKILSILKEG